MNNIHPPRSDRLARLCIFAALSGSGLGLLLTDLSTAGKPLLSQMATNVIALMYDDGFYYLEIARNLSLGLGSSFDGIHATNGYHPLWLLCCRLLFVFWADPEAVLVAGFLLQNFLFAGSGVCVFAAARRWAGLPASLLATLFWCFPFLVYRLPFSGLEFSLQCFLVCLTCLYFLRVRQIPTGLTAKHGILLGSACGLCFLTRIDYGPMGIILWATLVGQEKGPLIKRLTAAAPLAFLQPWLLCVAVYAAKNLIAFGALLPVSGAVKHHWSQHWLALDPIMVRHGWVAAKLNLLGWPLKHMHPLYAAAMYLGAGASLAAIPDYPRGFAFSPAPLRPWACFAVVHLGAFFLYYHQAYSFQPWYHLMIFWVGAMTLAAGCAHLSKRLGPSRGSIFKACLWVMLTAACAWGAKACIHMRLHQRSFPQTEVIYRGALWAAENLPPDARIGSWNAGMIAFLSQRTVINLDGLVNDRRFFERDRHDLCTYLKENRIDYLMDVFDTGAAFPPQSAIPGIDLSPCGREFQLLWSGPLYPQSQRGIAVYSFTAP